MKRCLAICLILCLLPAAAIRSEEAGDEILFPAAEDAVPDAPGALLGYGEAEDAACPHLHRRWTKQQETTLEAVSAREHRQTSIRYVLVTCEDCGARWERREIGRDVSLAPHSFVERPDADGICDQCGYVNACPHTNAYPEDSYWNPVYRELPEDNRSHEAASRHASYRYCPDCGAYLDWTPDAVSTLQAHVGYEDGICDLCGHENTCRHESARYWTRYSYPVESCEPIPGDDAQHRITAAYYTGWDCPDCGLTFDVACEGVRTGAAAHLYDAGTGQCLQCGHVCGHSAPLLYGEAPLYTEFIDLNDPLIHREARHVRCTESCPFCGVVLSSREETRLIDVVHRFGPDGACLDCGWSGVLNPAS